MAAHTYDPGTPGGASDALYVPRSYLINGFDDYFAVTLVDSNGFNDQRWQDFLNHRYPFGMPESAIPQPAATIVFGEKVSDSRHIHMDFLQGLGDDVTEVENGRHFRSTPSTSRSGGSNYAMADGHVQFLKYGLALAPANLWAVSDAWRTNNFPAP